MNIGLDITSLIPMIQCAYQMTVLKTLSITCCSVRNTLSTELCSLAKLPPFAHLMELIVTHWTVKNCLLFYCMETMPLMNLQIRTFSPQQYFTSTLQTDLFSCRNFCYLTIFCLFFFHTNFVYSFLFLFYFIFFYLFTLIFISYLVKGFIPIGIKNISTTYSNLILRSWRRLKEFLLKMVCG